MRAKSSSMAGPYYVAAGVATQRRDQTIVVRMGGVGRGPGNGGELIGRIVPIILKIARAALSLRQPPGLVERQGRDAADRVGDRYLPTKRVIAIRCDRGLL